MYQGCRGVPGAWQGCDRGVEVYQGCREGCTRGVVQMYQRYGIGIPGCNTGGMEEPYTRCRTGGSLRV